MDITKEDLFDIITEGSYRFITNLRSAYKENKLEEFLMNYGMEDLLPQKSFEFQTLSDGKILIVGQSKVKANDIYGIFNSLGFNKDRIELCLGYEEAGKYNFSKLHYNGEYRLIMFGPMPHSVRDKKDNSSIIAKMEKEEGYPKVIRLGNKNELNITKTSIRSALKEEIKSGNLKIS